MTVKELIEILETYPEDSEVLVRNSDSFVYSDAPILWYSSEDKVIIE